MILRSQDAFMSCAFTRAGCSRPPPGHLSLKNRLVRSYMFEVIVSRSVDLKSCRKTDYKGTRRSTTETYTLPSKGVRLKAEKSLGNPQFGNNYSTFPWRLKRIKNQYRKIISRQRFADILAFFSFSSRAFRFRVGEGHTSEISGSRRSATKLALGASASQP